MIQPAILVVVTGKANCHLIGGSMELDKNHISIRNAEVIRQICQPLMKNSPVSFFIHSRVFDDGYTMDYASNSEWQLEFYKKDFHTTSTIQRMKPGINYWRKNKAITLTEIGEYAKKNFDIDNKIDFITRGDGYFDLFGFGASKRNSNKATNYYDYHQSDLLKFIAYFCSKIIKLSPEYSSEKITLPNYKSPDYNVKRYFDEEVGSDKLSVTSKEFACLLLYSQGFSVKQIANLLNRSMKTINLHISKVKVKTNCVDRQSMNAYVRENRWDKLVNFFVSVQIPYNKM